MRKGRCKYPVNILVRADTRLREDAGEILRSRGSSISAFVRDQLRAVITSSREART